MPQKPNAKKPTEAISIRRQKAKMNGLCKICTVETPVKDTEICKLCTIKRDKFKRTA